MSQASTRSSKPLETPKNANTSESKIITNMNKQFQQLNEKFANLTEEFSSFKSEISSLVSSKSAEVECLQSEVTALKLLVAKLEMNIEDQNAYERRDCIILSGDSIPLASDGENCINIVNALVKEKLKIQLTDADVSTAHRVGKKPLAQGPDRRNIIAKLCRRSLKRDIMYASKNQPTNAPRLYVNESLTPVRSTILFALRQMRKAHPDLVVGCSSYDGRIFAYTKDPNNGAERRNRRHLVNSREMLLEFCRNYVKVPLESFLDSWNH